MTAYHMRPAAEVDHAIIIDLHEREHVGDLLDTPTLEDVERRRQRASAKDFVAFDSSGRPAGLLLIDHPQPWLAELSRIVAAREGAGIGSFVLGWALQFAFEELRVHRVFLEVHERNVRARRLYERFGFLQEGTYRDGFRNPVSGTFENLCPYGLLADEYHPS